MYVEYKNKRRSKDDLFLNDEQDTQLLIDFTNDPCFSLSELAARSCDIKKAFQNEKDLLGWCYACIQESPVGARLSEKAQLKKWSVALDLLNNGDYCLDPEKKRIVLDHNGLNIAVFNRSSYFRNRLLSSFIKALRDVWHEITVSSYDGFFTAEDFLKTERVRIADISTVSVFVAWELRSAGYGDMWRYFLGSDESDMAVAFSAFLERSPSAQFDESALSVIFDQFFSDEDRIRTTDNETLDYMDGLVQANDVHNPFGSELLGASLVKKLTSLPDGSSYMDGQEQAVIRDPFYAGMTDPINQAYLLHIMYDLEVYMVENVPFRDRKLARMIFPESEIVSF